VLNKTLLRVGDFLTTAELFFGGGLNITMSISDVSSKFVFGVQKCRAV